MGVIILAVSNPVFAGEVSELTAFTAGSTAKASEVNGNFDAIRTAVNGSATDIQTLQGAVTGIQGDISTIQDAVETIQSTLTGSGQRVNLVTVTRADTQSGAYIYNKNPDARWIRITVIGGGGSGGGMAATTSNNGESAGGGGGGACIKVIQNQDVTSTVQVVVGAGGPPANGNNPGNAGGESSFGAYCVAGGGSGGGAGSQAGVASAGSGGVGQSGDFNFSGGDGGNGGGNGEALYVLHLNFGGSSLMTGITSGGSNAGVQGKFPGGGSPGVRSGIGVPARSSAAAGDGVVYIEEYL